MHPEVVGDGAELPTADGLGRGQGRRGNPGVPFGQFGEDRTGARCRGERGGWALSGAGSDPGLVRRAAPRAVVPGGGEYALSHSALGEGPPPSEPPSGAGGASNRGGLESTLRPRSGLAGESRGARPISRHVVSGGQPALGWGDAGAQPSGSGAPTPSAGRGRVPVPSAPPEGGLVNQSVARTGATGPGAGGSPAGS